MEHQIVLDCMTIKQLKRLQRDVENAIASLDNREKKQRAKAKLEKEAQKMGFNLEEFFEDKVKTSRKPVQPKYRNPDDMSQTWSGRGREPIWVKEARSRGFSLKDMLIEES